MSNAAILLGAGNSTRLEGFVNDKIVATICDKPVFAYSIEAFIKSTVVDTLVIVYKDLTQKNIIEEWLQNSIIDPIQIFWCQGGPRRQDSVFLGLNTLPETTKNVFIHDLARPLIQSHLIETLHEMLSLHKAVALGHRIVDSIKELIPTPGPLLKDIDRSKLWGMETPQAFSYDLVLTAYQELKKQNTEVTDDTGVVSIFGHTVKILENKHPNPKITLKKDLDYITFLLNQNNYAWI